MIAGRNSNNLLCSLVQPLAPLILLVDDFSDALEMYEEYFTYRGFRIVTAASGPEAVLIASGPDRPALILMDLEMRGMSGREALRTLRANPTLDGVPILAFTAHALAAERDIAMRDGFDAVISKPCLPDDLIAIVEPYLAQHRSATA